MIMWEIYKDVCTTIVSGAIISMVLLISILGFIDIIDWIKGGKNGE